MESIFNLEPECFYALESDSKSESKLTFLDYSSNELHFEGAGEALSSFVGENSVALIDGHCFE